MKHDKPVERTPEQQKAEEAFRNAGHPAEKPDCDHAEWTFDKHGRCCPCGTFMMSFGD